MANKNVVTLILTHWAPILKEMMEFMSGPSRLMYILMKLFIQSDINVSVEPQIINKCPHELSLKVLISPFCDNGAIMD